MTKLTNRQLEIILTNSMQLSNIVQYLPEPLQQELLNLEIQAGYAITPESIVNAGRCNLVDTVQTPTMEQTLEIFNKIHNALQPVQDPDIKKSFKSIMEQMELVRYLAKPPSDNLSWYHGN